MVSNGSPEATPEKRVVEAIESADTLAALEELQRRAEDSLRAEMPANSRPAASE